jgi:regulator of sigma E protease
MNGLVAWIVEAVLTIVSFLAMISVIAVIHEFGHYIVCKILGVRVDEFSIGFGKLLFSKQWGETEYCLRAYPIAAYVRPAGMDSAELEDDKSGYVDPGERGFNRKNSLVAFLTVLYWGIGEGISTIKVSDVTAGDPAQVAGIRAGDIFTKIDGHELTNDRKGILYIRKHANVEISIDLLRGKETKTIKVIPREVDGDGRIGIMSERYFLSKTPLPLGFGEALSTAVEETWGYATYAYMQALGMLKGAFTKREMPKGIGGPVSIVKTVRDVVHIGLDWQKILSLLAMLSMAIGVFNLLPIPALDGGRILVLFIRDVLDSGYVVLFWKKPDQSVFSHRAEELVHVLGFLGLFLLLIVVTFKDIGDIIHPHSDAPTPHSSVAPSPGPSPAK